MKRHTLLWRRLSWCGFAACLVLMASAGASMRWSLLYQGADYQWTVESGRIGYWDVTGPAGTVRNMMAVSPRGWSILGSAGRSPWGWPRVAVEPPGSRSGTWSAPAGAAWISVLTVEAPLWLPTVVCAGLTWLAWRRSHARPPAGHCVQCGYNLAGNVSGRCPECGATASTGGPGASRAE